MLSWGKIKLGYKGSISFIGDQVTDENKFTTKNLPDLHEQKQLDFKTDQLTGTWVALDEPFSYDLYDHASGKIHWHCVQPKSNVILKTQTDTITGHGYVEKIELTLPPWKIPIKELIWGRYNSANNSIVWIRWKGSYPQTLVFFNGKKVDNAQVSETEVSFDKYTLLIANTKTIREETIGESVFKYLGPVIKYFPPAIMTLHEAKYCATGVFMCGSDNVDSGTIIHELVKWP